MGFLDRLHPASRTPGNAEPNIAYFVARLGGEAEEWAVEYTRPDHVELMSLTERAVRALRSRQIEEGSRLLQRAEDILRAAAGAPREVHLLLGRWYHQALAYFFYAREDFQGADASLDRGEELVRQAIQGRSFLLPYAMRCYELWCHRLRVARVQRLWPELSRRVEVTRRMVEGEGPLCVLDSGRAVGIEDVKAFYARFEDLDEREKRPLLRVVDDESRRSHFVSILSEVYVPAGFVIPYAPEPASRAAAHP